MKKLLLITLLIAAGAMQAQSGELSFQRSDTAVFSFEKDGSLDLKNPPVRELSTNPVTAHGLAMAKDSTNKLWTNTDQVNISGNVISVSSELGLVFHNDSTGDSVLLTNTGNLETNTTSEANLVRVDMYLDNHVIETDIENSQKKEYCGFGDGRIEYDSGQVVDRFYLKDHLGSTRAVIDGSGTPVEAVSYDAYGAIIRSNILAGNEEPTKEKFTGKEYDTSGFVAGGIACGLQLDYFGARYYDPEIGGWTSCDAAGQFFNPYGYGGNGKNPVLYLDADGNIFGVDDVLIAVIIGAIVGAYSGYNIGRADRATGWDMAGYILGGAIIGGASGYAGAYVAGYSTIAEEVVTEHGLGLGATAGIAVGSTLNSIGMNALSGGKTDFSTSIGAASYDWSKGTGRYLGESGNSVAENFGFTMGLLENINDVLNGVDAVEKTMQENRINSGRATDAEKFAEKNHMLRNAKESYTGKDDILATDEIFKYDRSHNWWSDWMGDKGNHGYNYRMADGIHLTANFNEETQQFGNFLMHYDFYNPCTSPLSLIMHGYFEVGRLYQYAPCLIPLSYNK